MIDCNEEDRNPPVAADAELASVFAQAARALVKKQPHPPIEARFYPYAGLSSTIRLRQGRIYVRVSDILRRSPREVLYALACILVAKLYRLKAPADSGRVYRQYTLDPMILDASESTRRSRGYKITTSPRGKAYDLDELFANINARYFEDQLPRPQLSWSPRPTRRVLGRHDHIHNVIIISRTLDKAEIPRFLVEYVLYHEMLHVKHPPKVAAGRTVYHGAKFRAEERRFEHFDEALKLLGEIALPPRRRVRRRRKRA